MKIRPRSRDCNPYSRLSRCQCGPTIFSIDKYMTAVLPRKVLKKMECVSLIVQLSNSTSVRLFAADTKANGTAANAKSKPINSAIFRNTSTKRKRFSPITVLLSQRRLASKHFRLRTSAKSFCLLQLQLLATCNLQVIATTIATCYCNNSTGLLDVP